MVTNVTLLGFDTTLHPELQVEHYRLSREGQVLPTVGDTIAAGSIDATRTLRVFQFYIGT